MTPGDIAILFRTRESHREFEDALERQGIAAHVYKGLGFFDADEIKDVRAILWYLADPVSDLRAASLLRSRFVRVSDDALRLLAPRLSSMLQDGIEAEQRARLDGEDVEVLLRAHRALERWRTLADRMPPAELLDLIIHESAYLVEIRGPRLEQARENLKKIRALVRRLQNRGYATLPRVASHLDHLAIGDEANAPVDARDAVSLMTVHAAKGLEFPVVFVVNLTRGTAGYRDPIRIFSDPAADSVSVSVGDFLSEADEDAGARESEESKRLLYVALTRARDRLYLGATLKDGRLQIGRGSLAEVMPATLLASLSSVGGESSRWVGSSGDEHRLMRVSQTLTSTDEPVARPISPETEALVDREPIPVTLAGRGEVVGSSVSGVRKITDAPASDRVRGLAVHRLLQRRRFEPWSSSSERHRSVLGVLRREELLELEDPEQFVEAVAGMYQNVCERSDVASLYEKGECYHEVSFSLRDAEKVVRGTIDCLIRLDEARLVVLEFKTGRPRAEHEAQLALYCRAVRSIFPSCSVDARLIYSASTATGHFAS